MTRLRFVYWVGVGLAAAGLVLALASGCHHVEDGRAALCLGVTAHHGLCVEWAPRP